MDYRLVVDGVGVPNEVQDEGHEAVLAYVASQQESQQPRASARKAKTEAPVEAPQSEG